MKTFRLLLLSLLLSSGLVCAQEAVREQPEVGVFSFSGGPIQPEAEVNDGARENLIRQKLNSIKVPKVSFESVPLDIAFDFLMSQSVELDTQELNPAKKGVSIVLRPQSDTNPDVSVQGENLSLEEAISLVARAADQKWRVSNGAVVIGGQIWGPNVRGNLSLEIEKTLTEWNSIILPSVDFNNTPLSEVIEIIQRKVVELDSKPPTLPIEFRIHPSTEDLKSADHRVNLSLWNATAFDVLAHALVQAGYDFDVRENEFQVDDLGTMSYALEWDHWLWMMRIAKRDPSFIPPDFDPSDQKIRMFERKSAMQIYEACGIEVNKGESFIYGPTTTLMIARLGGKNRERVQMIHKTMEDWKAGRTNEWHLDWMPR